MERLEKDWNVYPVFHIDFSLTKYTTLFDLQEQLNLFLLRCEKVYGAEKEEKTPAARLQGMIRRAYEQTGLPVVVLIDEYDAPLWTVIPTSPCSRSFGMNCVSFQSSQGIGAIPSFPLYHGNQQVQPDEHLQ